MEYRRKSAVKWNLMLLAGRPIASVGCFWLLCGSFLSRQQVPEAVATGLLLVLLGFVIGWTGKIGKVLFFEGG